MSHDAITRGIPQLEKLARERDQLRALLGRTLDEVNRTAEWLQAQGHQVPLGLVAIATDIERTLGERDA